MFPSFPGKVQHIQVDGGDLLYIPDFLEPEESISVIENLRQEIAWKQETISLFGKQYLTPRLTAWYGDPGAAYSYSGLKLQPEAWTKTLLLLKQKAEIAAGCSFNSVLLNWYRQGADSMGWHADDEKELGKNPVIGSISLGAKRTMRFRRKDNHRTTFKTELSNGSLLIMQGEIQHYWQHAIPKSLAVKEDRINLTFRKIFLSD